MRYQNPVQHYDAVSVPPSCGGPCSQQRRYKTYWGTCTPVALAGVLSIGLACSVEGIVHDMMEMPCAVKMTICCAAFTFQSLSPHHHSLTGCVGARIKSNGLRTSPRQPSWTDLARRPGQW